LAPNRKEEILSLSEPAQRDLDMFYDGACPLCRRETNWLRRWDRRGRLRFIDISAPDFRAADLGKTQEELMARLHARLPDGRWIEGVEVFRQLYAAIGLGPLVALTRMPGVAQMLEWGYTLFARNRLRLTGRCGAEGCAVPPGRERP